MHTLKHSNATHVLESVLYVATVQALLGNGEERFTLGYLHALRFKLIKLKSLTQYESIFMALFQYTWIMSDEHFISDGA